LQIETESSENCNYGKKIEASSITINIEFITGIRAVKKKNLYKIQSGMLINEIREIAIGMIHDGMLV
jgi:hypothetical protein